MKLTRVDAQILALAVTLAVAMLAGDTEVAHQLVTTLVWLVAG